MLPNAIRCSSISIALCALVACAEPTLPSGSDDSASGDQGQLVFGDLANPLPDTRLAEAAGGGDIAARDLRLDTTLARPDRGAKPRCTAWSDWSCRTGAIFPCRADCTGGQSRSLLCNNAGTCTCTAGGKATACSPQTPETGCALCRKAFQSGCCRP